MVPETVRRNYLIRPGVYSGYVVICLRCKGCTYVPFHRAAEGAHNDHMNDHELWCPVLLDEALQALH